MVFDAAVIEVGFGGGGDIQVNPMVNALFDEYP
jgi:hypothetical protein